MSSYFSQEFLGSLSPPTKLNPNASSFQPRNFDRPKVVQEEPSRPVKSESSRSVFYTPNPIASSGIVAYVNSRFVTVNRRDAQLLELLAPQRPFKIKDRCGYCYKRSPKTSRHHFKDKENRIICPLVGYKLAALRSYRKNNPSYKEMIAFNRRLKASKSLYVSKESNSSHEKSDSSDSINSSSDSSRMRSSSTGNSSGLFSSRSGMSSTYEIELHNLEADYYKKLQNSEREYSNKSVKEILEYMPISERIVARLRPMSTPHEDNSEAVTFKKNFHKVNDEAMSKTVDLSKLNFQGNFGLTYEPFRDGFTSADSYNSHSSDTSLKNHRRHSLAAKLNSSDRDITPSSLLSFDTNFSKSTSCTDSKDEKQKRPKRPKINLEHCKKKHEDNSSLVDLNSTSRSSNSSSNSVFTCDNSEFTISNSSKDIKNLDPDSSCQSDHSLDFKNHSLACTLENMTRNNRISPNVSKVSTSESLVQSCVQKEATGPVNKVTFPKTESDKEMRALLSPSNFSHKEKVNIAARENILLDSDVINKIWDIINGYSSKEYEQHVIVSIELWVINKLISRTTTVQPPIRLIENVLFQRVNHRKLSISAFLKQKLVGFTANISITNAVVQVLKLSGFFSELSMSTLNSFSFWKDLLCIWEKCYNRGTGVNERIIAEFKQVYGIMGDLSSVSHLFLRNISIQSSINHLCKDNFASFHEMNSTDDEVQGEKVNYLNKILCFPCLAALFMTGGKVSGGNEEWERLLASLHNIIVHLKGVFKQILNTKLEELELLDFFFDNRYFFVKQFAKNSNEDVRSRLLFDEEKVGQVRLVLQNIENNNLGREINRNYVKNSITCAQGYSRSSATKPVHYTLW